MPYTGCGLNHSVNTCFGPGRLAKRQTLKTSERRYQAPKKSAKPTSMRYGVGLVSHFPTRYMKSAHAPSSPAELVRAASATDDADGGRSMAPGHYSRQEAGNWILPPGYLEGSCASIFASGTLRPRRLRISSVQLESTRSLSSSAIGSTLISCRKATASFIMLRTSSL